jgi:hypothetical protein
MRTIWLFTLAPITLVCAASQLRAAPTGAASSTSPAAVSAANKLTNQDVDLLLREARSAIQQGKLDEADTLLKRVENANVRMSVFHAGPTPASVRRELTHAQHAAHPASKSQPPSEKSGVNRFLPFSRNGNTDTRKTTDPFLNRGATPNELATHPATSETPAASAAGGLATTPAALAIPGDSARLNSTAGTSSKIASAAEPVTNPFAAAVGAGGQTRASAEPPSPISTTAEPYPDTRSRSRAMPGRPANSSLNSLSLDNTSPRHDDTSWSLPDAPLPSGISDHRNAASSPGGPTPPQRPAATQTPRSSELPGDAKRQAQKRLSEARQALDAGNIDLADKLSHAAGALGVPESQFLPDEDRPSLVAWDIAQA